MDKSDRQIRILYVLTNPAMQRLSLALVLVLVLTGCASTPATRTDSQPSTVAPAGNAIDIMLMSEHLGPVAVGAERPLTFHLMQRGMALTQFDVTHEKVLHLIVVRNDLQHFQHMHPDLDPTTGLFTVPLTLPAEGTYAMYADFQPSGGTVTVLRKELAAGGPSTPTELSVDDSAQASGAYAVTPGLLSPIPAGVQTMLTYRIDKDGRPVGDLQNYLGAKGHAVMIKERTLEYYHTHPSDMTMAHGGAVEAPGPGEVHFQTEALAPGRYKVFAQFRPEGNLITVANVYEVTPTPEGIDLDVGHGEDHTAAEPAAREIRIEAFQYGYAPSDVRVKVGEPLEFVLSSRDVAHSFSVEGLGLNATILPDKETRLAFTPEQPGRYRFGCDVYCGEGHLDMSAEGGTLIVE